MYIIHNDRFQQFTRANEEVVIWKVSFFYLSHEGGKRHSLTAAFYHHNHCTSIQHKSIHHTSFRLSETYTCCKWSTLCGMSEKDGKTIHRAVAVCHNMHWWMCTHPLLWHYILSSSCSIAIRTSSHMSLSAHLSMCFTVNVIVRVLYSTSDIVCRTIWSVYLALLKRKWRECTVNGTSSRTTVVSLWCYQCVWHTVCLHCLAGSVLHLSFHSVWVMRTVIYSYICAHTCVCAILLTCS